MEELKVGEIHPNAKSTMNCIYRIRSTNAKYAPHLPPIESDTAYNYVLILDKKFSLQPLLQAVEALHSGSSRIQEPPILQNRKPNVSKRTLLLDDNDNDNDDACWHFNNCLFRRWSF